MPEDPTFQPILVFYDGVCASCSLAVRFLLARRRAARFRFISLQAIEGTALSPFFRRELKLPELSSVIVWKEGRFSTHSEALFVVLAELGWPWSLLLLLRLFPRGFRDRLYSLFARYRYQILGKVEAAQFCQVHTDQRHLFPTVADLAVNHELAISSLFRAED